MEKKNKREGFSLIELLGVIVIISLVLGIGGYYVIKVITSSEERSKDLAINSIKNIVSIYVEENKDGIAWQDEETTLSYTCVSIEELYNQGYLKKENINDVIKENKYVLVKKDENNTIVSYDLDNNVCGSDVKLIKIPTSSACQEQVYNNSQLHLVKNEVRKNYERDGVNVNDYLGPNAGSYDVVFSLSDKKNTKWADSTTDDKKITCSIKKAIPTIYFNPAIQSNEENITSNWDIILKSDTVGGKINLKTSNKNYATAVSKNGSNNIAIKEEKEITIVPTALKNNNTIITATLIPDNSNYYSVSTTYIIGKIITKSISTNPVCNDNLIEDGTTHKLVDSSPNSEYQVYNGSQSKMGKYEVIVRPKYGYSWSDGSASDRILYCIIKPGNFTLTYDSMGGSVCSPKTKTVTYGKEYGTLCSTSRSYYTFEGWYTDKVGGTSINKDTLVSASYDHTIYARWKGNPYKIKFNGNGSDDGNTEDMDCNYGESYNLNSNGFSRTGYTFNGWNTNQYGTGTNYSNMQPVSNLATSGTFNLYAKWKGNPYTINFDGNGATGGSTSSKNCTYDIDCTLTSNYFSKTNYYFNSWNTERNGTGTRYLNGDTVKNLVTSGSITLYAQWQDQPPEITITYYSNDGSGSSFSKKCDPTKDCYIESNSFSKTGYNFGGWNTDASGTGTNYSVNQNIKGSTSNLYLYAQWSRNFTCLSAGYTTTYAGKSWYTISNNGNTCELVLNEVSSGYGSYNSATSNLNSEYFSSGQLKTELNAGLITSYDGAGGTSSGLSSGVYWTSSGSVYHNVDISSYTTNTPHTYYYGWTTNATGPGEKGVSHNIGYSSSCSYNSCGADSISTSISNSSSSLTYNQLNTELMPKERDSTYYTIVKPQKTGKGGKLTINLDVYQNGSFLQTVEAKNSTLNFIECGGVQNGNTISTFNFVSNNPDKYHYKNFAPGDHADFDSTDFTRTFYTAGYPNVSGSTINMYSGSTCKVHTYYTTTSVSSSIHYRLHIKVKM